jgi:hypothetical protein
LDVYGTLRMGPLTGSNRDKLHLTRIPVTDVELSPKSCCAWTRVQIQADTGLI